MGSCGTRVVHAVKLPSFMIFRVLARAPNSNSCNWFLRWCRRHCNPFPIKQSLPGQSDPRRLHQMNRASRTCKGPQCPPKWQGASAAPPQGCKTRVFFNGGAASPRVDNPRQRPALAPDQSEKAPHSPCRTKCKWGAAQTVSHQLTWVNDHACTNNRPASADLPVLDYPDAVSRRPVVHWPCDRRHGNVGPVPGDAHAG